MTEYRRSKRRDFILLVYGIFLGMIGNLIAEIVLKIYSPSPEELPMLLLFMHIMLGFYLVSAFWALWRFG